MTESLSNLIAPDRVVLPSFVLKWTTSPQSDSKGEGRRLDVETRGVKAPFITASRNNRSAGILGYCIVGDKIDTQSVLERLLSVDDIVSVARGLNGQFLLFAADEDSGKLQIANDRFTSFPLYWATTRDGFVGSLLYDDLITHIRNEPGFRWKAEAMIEYLWLQKLLHTKTYDSISSFLPPATRLIVRQDKIDASAYWRMDFAKRTYRNEAEAAALFSELFASSLERKVSDNRKYGLFLSGGHDSRAILGALPRPPHCFTVSFRDNYEVSCARRAAAERDAPFTFIKFPDDFFITYQDAMSRLCGGMYAGDHALFLGLDEIIGGQCDVVFHGHGLDYMYQGMYLPAKTTEWFGRPTFIKTLQPLDGDVCRKFLDGISFGMLDRESRDLLRADVRKSVDDALMESVRDVVVAGGSGLHNPADQWEYLIVHSLARHYTHPNVMSKSTAAEQRIASFDNDLFDFYLSLPNEYRVSAQMLRHELNHRHPRLGRIPTGNLGLPAGASPLEKTLLLAGRKALRHLTGRQSFKAPSAADRTWPDRDTYIRAHAPYRKMIEDAVMSDLMPDVLPQFDWPRARTQVQEWLQQPAGGAKFMVGTLTLHKFLSRHH